MRLTAWTVGLGLVAGCEPPPPPPSAPVEMAAPPPVVPAPPSATAQAAPIAPDVITLASAGRWMLANRRAEVVAAVKGGTLVLLGGRRAVVAPDGSVTPEKVAAPEAIEALEAVPTTGGPVIVGVSDTHVYRFDDPLGAAVPIVDLSAVHFPRLGTVRRGTIEISDIELKVTTYDARTGAPVAAGVGPDVRPRTRARRLSPALLRWIDATGQDPLALAVTHGARLDERTAVVASSGLVARVDLDRGTLIDLITYPEAAPADRKAAPGDCEAAHAGGEIWLFCPWVGSVPGMDKKAVPFGALRVRADAPRLRVDLARTFETRGRKFPHALVVSSAQGGLHVREPCDLHGGDQGPGRICVRQPDGSFSPLARASWPDHTVRWPILPLSDGRIAYLLGQDGQDPLRMELLGASGPRVLLPSLPVNPRPARTYFRSEGFDEWNGVLELAVTHHEWPPGHQGGWDEDKLTRTGWLVAQPLDGTPATARRFPPHVEAMHAAGGHLVAVQKGERGRRVLFSTDGGATVHEDTPGEMRRRVEDVFVNDVGALVLERTHGPGWLCVWGHGEVVQ